MVIYSAVSYFLSIFPIFLTVSTYLDLENKRLNFALILFGYVKILGGYIKNDKTKIYFHISENKAIMFDLAKLKSGNGMLKNLKSLEIVSLKILKVFPYSVRDAFIASLIVNAENILVPIYKTKKDFVSLKSDTQVRGDKTQIFLHVTVMFNLVVIGNIILKMLWSKVFKK